MITSFAQFLQELQAKEASLLAEEEVRHGPTIGDMYEGLARELLERAIPEELNLRLLQGFVVGVDGSRSHQTDAMLVMGEGGRQIPRTDSWEWPIADVLAVFEVKKNLFGAELLDSMNKMRGISKQQQTLLEQNIQVHLGPSRNAFALVTGRLPLAKEEYDLESAEAEIYRTVAHEQLAPLRVVFGYEGYADEYGLRKGFLDALEAAPENLAGPAVLPNLIICRTNTIIKLTGHPYITRLREDGYWELFASSSKAPYAPLLELIWTRLANQFKARFPVDDQLEMESLVPLLAGKQVIQDGRRGWLYSSTEFSRARLTEDRQETLWSPLEITEGEGILCDMALSEGGLDLDDPEMIDGANRAGIDLAAFAAKLVEDRQFCWSTPRIAVPISETIYKMFTPDGRLWVASNRDLLSLWAKDYLEKAKKVAV